MGLIRVILAIAVVIGHSPIQNSIMISGPMAVQIFFIISGFYIAFILNEKYHSYKHFLINRALKIYPVYFVILILTISFSMIKWKLYGGGTFSNWIHIIQDFDIVTIIYSFFANITLIGQDFYWVFKDTTLITNRHIFVTQAWTLGAEMLFYILAFLLYKLSWKKIIPLTLIFVYIRYSIGIQFGIESIYFEKFFPAIFVYFLFGIISYKIYRIIIDKKIIVNKHVGQVILLILAFITVFYGKISNSIIDIVYQVSYIFLIPIIFIASKNIKFDRAIAELSYPIYISHVLILYLFHAGFDYFGIQKTYMWIGVLGVTLVFSYILYIGVMKPIDKMRQKNVQ